MAGLDTVPILPRWVQLSRCSLKGRSGHLDGGLPCSLDSYARLPGEMAQAGRPANMSILGFAAAPQLRSAFDVLDGGTKRTTFAQQ
jgi:hypothetical protein